MRENDTVGYFTADGMRHQATVTAVVGKGESHFKTLDLSYRKDGEAVTVTKVPHENDAKEGEPFWLEKGVKRKPVVRRLDGKPLERDADGMIAGEPLNLTDEQRAALPRLDGEDASATPVTAAGTKGKAAR